MIRPRYAPEFFDAQKIKFSIPYTMPGELMLGPNQSGVAFPAETFRHNVDKPFEIWQMLVRLTAFDDSNPAVLLDVLPPTLDRRIRLTLNDESKNERITKSPALISTLQEGLIEMWAWDPRPYTIVRQEGFTLSASSDAFPVVCVPSPEDCTPVATPVGQVRVEVQFQGFLLVLEPPGPNR